MFATINDVERITGYEVTEDLVVQAQMIIESYVGRTEVEVTNASDQLLLARATAYQAAYMKADPMRIYEQMAVKQLGQFGQLVTFRDTDTAAPFVAPLAVMACHRLSWKRMRSVKTGTIYGPNPPVEGWSQQ